MAQPNPGRHDESPASQGVGWKKEIDQLLANLRKAGTVEIDDQIGAVIISDWVAGIIKAEAKRGTRKVSVSKKIWRNLIKPTAVVSASLMLGVASCFCGILLFIHVF